MAASGPSHSDRISALEEGYKSIGREVHGLRTDLQDFASEVRRQLSAAQKTPWSPLLGAIAVAVSILGGLVTLGASGPLRDLGRHDTQIDRIIDRMNQIQNSRFSDQDGMRLDAKLRQEMRDLDMVNSARTDALDTMLQREMRLLVKPVEARLLLLEARVEKHQEDGHPYKGDATVRGLIDRLKLVERK